MADRASPFAGNVAGSKAGISLSAVPRGALWQVACWPESFDEAERTLATECGCDAPGPGVVSQTRDGGLLIRVEPLKWWITGPDGSECPHRPEADQGAWLDMSHDQAGIVVMGENAAELLKRMVPIDLRGGAFADLSFATTQMHHMITRVLRRDRDGMPAYEVMVMRSFADDLHEIAAHHLEHFPASPTGGSVAEM